LLNKFLKGWRKRQEEQDVRPPRSDVMAAGHPAEAAEPVLRVWPMAADTAGLHGEWELTVRGNDSEQREAHNALVRAGFVVREDRAGDDYEVYIRGNGEQGRTLFPKGQCGVVGDNETVLDALKSLEADGWDCRPDREYLQARWGRPGTDREDERFRPLYVHGSSRSFQLAVEALEGAGHHVVAPFLSQEPDDTDCFSARDDDEIEDDGVVEADLPNDRSARTAPAGPDADDGAEAVPPPIFDCASVPMTTADGRHVDVYIVAGTREGLEAVSRAVEEHAECDGLDEQMKALAVTPFNILLHGDDGPVTTLPIPNRGMIVLEGYHAPEEVQAMAHGAGNGTMVVRADRVEFRDTEAGPVVICRQAPEIPVYDDAAGDPAELDAALQEGLDKLRAAVTPFVSCGLGDLLLEDLVAIKEAHEAGKPRCVLLLPGNYAQAKVDRLRRAWKETYGGTDGGPFIVAAPLDAAPVQKPGQRRRKERKNHGVSTKQLREAGYTGQDAEFLVREISGHQKGGMSIEAATEAALEALMGVWQKRAKEGQPVTEPRSIAAEWPAFWEIMQALGVTRDQLVDFHFPPNRACLIEGRVLHLLRLGANAVEAVEQAVVEDMEKHEAPEALARFLARREADLTVPRLVLWHGWGLAAARRRLAYTEFFQMKGHNAAWAWRESLGLVESQDQIAAEYRQRFAQRIAALGYVGDVAGRLVERAMTLWNGFADLSGDVAIDQAVAEWNAEYDATLGASEAAVAAANAEAALLFEPSPVRPLFTLLDTWEKLHEALCRALGLTPGTFAEREELRPVAEVTGRPLLTEELTVHLLNMALQEAEAIMPEGDCAVCQAASELAYTDGVRAWCLAQGAALETARRIAYWAAELHHRGEDKHEALFKAIVAVSKGEDCGDSETFRELWDAVFNDSEAEGFDQWAAGWIADGACAHKLAGMSAYDAHQTARCEYIVNRASTEELNERRWRGSGYLGTAPAAEPIEPPAVEVVDEVAAPLTPLEQYVLGAITLHEKRPDYEAAWQRRYLADQAGDRPSWLEATTEVHALEGYREEDAASIAEREWDLMHAAETIGPEAWTLYNPAAQATKEFHHRMLAEGQGYTGRCRCLTCRKAYDMRQVVEAKAVAAGVIEAPTPDSDEQVPRGPLSRADRNRIYLEFARGCAKGTWPRIAGEVAARALSLWEQGCPDSQALMQAEQEVNAAHAAAAPAEVVTPPTEDSNSGAVPDAPQAPSVLSPKGPGRKRKANV
jgi:hypothetical protein